MNETTIHPATQTRNLVVILTPSLTLNPHIPNLTLLRSILFSPFLNSAATASVEAPTISHSDCGNSFLADLSTSSLDVYNPSSTFSEHKSKKLVIEVISSLLKSSYLTLTKGSLLPIG